MSRKNFILIISAIVLIIMGGIVLFYYSSKTGNIPTNVVSSSTNPFGGTPGEKAAGTSTTNQQGDKFGTINEISNGNKLIQLYRNPTSGSIFYTNKNNQSVLRFVDRAVGNIYEYLPDNQTGEVQRITNTTIPKIQESIWSSTGDGLILRYLDNDTDIINSFSSKISPSTSPDSPGEISGLFLAQNIKQLAINPRGDKIFGLLDKSDKSGTYGFTGNLDGGGKKTIFDSPMLYWNISWPKENVIALTTKPNFTEPGFLYFFNPQTFSFERILGNVIGLSSLINKDAGLVAYSHTTNDSFLLDIYNISTKTYLDLKMPTLADKCVWGNNDVKVLYCAIPKDIAANNYPDAWYQGVQSFNDDIWKIDTETGSINQLYGIGSNEAIDMDVLELKISPDDKYLSLLNKNDLSLWLLEIK